MIAFISICVIVVFSVACAAACSLVNYYNAPQRQKSAKAVAIPMIVLAVVCVSWKSPLLFTWYGL